MTTAMKRFRHLRSLVLSMLLVASLAACAATGPVTGQPIEGPVRLGEIAAVDGPRVRPDSVIEDSRCPPDVQCIVEGRLIVRATVMGAAGLSRLTSRWAYQSLWPMAC